MFSFFACWCAILSTNQEFNWLGTKHKLFFFSQLYSRTPENRHWQWRGVQVIVFIWSSDERKISYINNIQKFRLKHQKTLNVDLLFTCTLTFCSEPSQLADKPAAGLETVHVQCIRHREWRQTNRKLHIFVHFSCNSDHVTYREKSLSQEVWQLNYMFYPLKFDQTWFWMCKSWSVFHYFMSWNAYFSVTID